MSEVESPWWNFKYWFEKTFVYPIENFFIWIGKSCKYAWLLRDDFDWDYAFLFRIMRYKMTRMAKNIQSNAHVEGHQRIHDELMEAVTLLKRISEDNYISEEMGVLLDKSWERYEEDGYRKSKRKKLTKKQEARLRKLMQDSENERQADIELFFKQFKERFQGWWD